MLAKNVKQEVLEAELKKCICLCSNCHREFHHFAKTKGITLEEYLT
jgi:predicted HNH restriction endonuclease